MIKATITTVDGDKIEMVFSCMADIWKWSEQNAGKYTGIDFDTQQKRMIEHDNDGADCRIKRSGGSN